MELSKKVLNTIDRASMRAKPLFDMCGWVWTPIGGIPSFVQIRDTYIRLAEDAKAQADDTDPELQEASRYGNCSTGRLTVEYEDGSWLFGIVVDDYTEPY